MRVYLPSTTVGLRGLLESGAHATGEEPAFAVTAGLREWYGTAAGGDADLAEELEYAALSEAARASLRLLDRDAAAPRRRVVVAVEVPDDFVDVHDDLAPGAVHVGEPVVMAAVAAVHVDDADAEPAVAVAATALAAADDGDPDAIGRVDAADEFELSWYANQEIATVLAGL